MYILILLGIIVFVSLIFLIQRLLDHYINNPRRKLRRKIFTSRKIMDVQEWYDTYYKPDGVSFASCKLVSDVIANKFRCHPTQILPTDSIENTLRIKLASSIGIDEDDELFIIEAELFDMLGKNNADELFSECKTISDIVRVYGQAHGEVEKTKEPTR